MKKLMAIFVVLLLTSFTIAQTSTSVTQSGATNDATVTQSDAGPSNVGGNTYALTNQTAGTDNDLVIDQLGRKSDIKLTQTAGTYNDATIFQKGNYDNHFYIDGSAGGYNKVDISLGQEGGGDIHDNDYFVDQTAAGNNDLMITSLGNHVYSHNKIDVDQTASVGNNSASINMDGDWRRNVNVKSEQTSEDNLLSGTVRGESVDVDIYQSGALNNSATFDVLGNNTILNSTQNSSVGANTLISTQSKNSNAVINQTSGLGDNTATVMQR